MYYCAVYVCIYCVCAVAMNVHLCEADCNFIHRMSFVYCSISSPNNFDQVQPYVRGYIVIIN